MKKNAVEPDPLKPKRDASNLCFPITNAGSDKARQILKRRSRLWIIYNAFSYRDPLDLPPPVNVKQTLSREKHATETIALKPKGNHLPLAYVTVQKRRSIRFEFIFQGLRVMGATDLSGDNPPDRAALDGKDLKTFFAVQLEEYSWDFMVPDVVRPLATISIRALIISVIRLGMHFQDFDLSKGIIHAQGNGQSIVSYDVHGLGMVIRYNSNRRANGSSDETLLRPKMAPSEAADKMIFGIIPGNGKRCDLNLVDDDEGTRLSEQSLMRVGLPWTHRQRLFQRQIPGIPWGPEVIQMALTDLTALWSPYIPVLKSETARICHPLRVPIAVSPFLGWEGRKVLKRRLELRRCSSIMQDVYEKLDFLESFFMYDFYTSWDNAIMPEWDDNSRAPDRLAIAHFFSEFGKRKDTWIKITRGMDGINSVQDIETEAGNFDQNLLDKEEYFVRSKTRLLAILSEFWHWSEKYFADKKKILGTPCRINGENQPYLPAQEDFFRDMVLQHTILANSAVDESAERYESAREYGNKVGKQDVWGRFNRGVAGENEDFVKEFRGRGWKNDKGTLKGEAPKGDAQAVPYMVSIAHLYVDRLEKRLIRSIWLKYRRYKSAEKRTSVVNETMISGIMERDDEPMEDVEIPEEERLEIEEAWWVLIFRGTVWFMSIWMTLGHRPFPSALYDSDTPVWIS
ncbi:MAG: hypothetical protein M1821_008773 [Bathelium mastoideum]|nr:MAG: hypothetical protein M1821_008773 [Bathelium mastoideum]